jgi:hypothetical protein
VITTSVTGDERIAGVFKKSGSTVRERVKMEIARQAAALTSYIANEELSGQMLRVRTGKLRTKMTYKLFDRKAGTVYAEVFPKTGSALWALGSGMAPETLYYQMRVRSQDVRARVFKNGKKRRKIVSKGYAQVARTHHLNKIPFMEAAIASHRDIIRNGIEKAVAEAVATVAGVVDSGGGI